VSNTHIKHFTPSSTSLLDQIRRAEEKFEADREQALLAREARAEQRMARALDAEVKARHYRRMYGLD